MEQRVVRRRNGPSQTSLTRVRGIQVRQMLSQLKQFVGICHRSCPRFFLENCLLGLAAEVIIRQDAPLFEGLETLDNRSCYLVRGVQELISATGSVRKDDSEEDSRLPTPILSKGVPQTHNIGAKRLPDCVDSLVELRLLCKRSGDVHNLIITRLEGGNAQAFNFALQRRISRQTGQVARRPHFPRDGPLGLYPRRDLGAS